MLKQVKSKAEHKQLTKKYKRIIIKERLLKQQSQFKKIIKPTRPISHTVERESKGSRAAVDKKVTIKT